MAVFAISDLHLSFGTDKPMDIFGDLWSDYENRVRENWQKIIKDGDIVILNGDNSWAMYLEDTYEDFKFINELPGTKILSKGNHDYWWTTTNKHNNYCAQKGFTKIKFLQNNHFMYNGIAICGTRGWVLSSADDNDLKVYNREQERLKLSLNSAIIENPEKIVVALHYPPDEKFIEIMREYNVSKCIYGHLHGHSHKIAFNGQRDGIDFRLVSCDYLRCIPLKIY